MTFGSLFAGVGGLDLGLERAGMECRWQVEKDEYCSRVLAKHWPGVRRYGDIEEVNGNELESVDLVAGGFPCQDVSAAGQGAGIIGARSGLWTQFARVLREVRPRLALIENVPALRGKGLALVLQDLWALGFDAEWHCIPASAVGAHHERDRVFILAYPEGYRRGSWGPWRFDSELAREQERIAQAAVDAYADRSRRGAGESGAGGRIESSHGDQAPHSHGARPQIRESISEDDGEELTPVERSSSHDADAYSEPLVRAAIARGERHAWTVEPGVVRMVHGVPHRVDRIRGLGNAVVPQVAEWLGHRIMEAFAE